MFTGVRTGLHATAFASEPPARAPFRAAVWLCLGAALATAALLPIAGSTGPAMPGFALMHQTGLVFAYSLSAWVLFTQYRRSPSLPLLLIAAGTLYTAAIVTLQMLSLPGIVAGGRVLGSGSETTIWLWSFWHVGPPGCAVAYALALRRRQHAPAPRAQRGARVVFAALAAAALAAVALAGLSALVATAGLPYLPHQVIGDDYSPMVTSGVGPAIQILTLAALAMVWRATRASRSALDLWLTVSLVLLVFDNFLTLAGGARGSVGWYAGRVEALISALVISWAFLHEVDALRARAEAAADDMARAGEALRHAQKMEAVGRLTGGIAHDFNNLLMVVSSGFEMILRRPDDRQRVTRMAEAGLEAAERGARLTRQLLTFARRQDLRPETVNLNALLRDFEPLACRALGEVAGLDLTLTPVLHPARIDRGEFESAVLNLIVNARDALPRTGGQIAVRTRNDICTASQPNREPDGLPAGGYVVVEVTDNGIGMDEATLAQVFEPFFTTKEFGKGSGLGLSQVYGFARASGGTVKIASVPGEGTTVEIWLPQAETAAKADTQRAAPLAALRRADAGETVLAVEDEPGVLSAVVENLADLGYRVVPARDAAEALQLLRQEERVDILFSDVVMPGGINGVQLAVEASRIRPNLRVVLTSGYTGEALTGEHSIPANVPILTKPYRREELAERLKAAS